MSSIKDEPTGRSPRATNWSAFYDSAHAHRPVGGEDPSGRSRRLLLNPLPHTPDIIDETGSRAEQYNS